MLIAPTADNLPFFEALASDVRLKIINMLSEEELNIKSIAEKLGISSPIVLQHIKKLEEAGLVTTRFVKRNGSKNKICKLVFAEYRLMLDFRRMGLPAVRTASIPVGHYCSIDGKPTCGLATEKGVIGFRDDPGVFWEPERVNAELLWFRQGYVEFRVPNYLTTEQVVTEIELSFEIASEAPDFVEDWPSDIIFYFNGIELGTWTSPGDYGVKRGLLTPDWWPSNQYGLLKTLHITQDGVKMDDEELSDVTLAEVLTGQNHSWNFRFEVAENAKNVGGLTLYGKKFGNHAQDIVVRTYFVRKKDGKTAE